MAPPPPPPIALFPPAPNIKLVTNKKLQDALDAATSGLSKKGYGLTIVDTGSAAADASEFPSAGVNDDIEHYAGSTLKAACMYAPFSLRDLVTRFNTARTPKDANALFQMIRKELDPRIAVCCPMIQGRADSVRSPAWRDMFEASGKDGTVTVNFTRDYAKSLWKMIVPSDNNEAGRCIRGVGYAYLNGLMLNHGFFDTSAKKGVWLAGDYGSSEVVTIPCDNDKDTKPGTTSAMMARLGLSIFVQRILPGTSSAGMLELLRQSAHGTDSSYFTREEMGVHALTGDQVTHGKIGLGDLKSRRKVFADLNAINNPVGHAGNFTVCYTNVDYNPYSIQAVLKAFTDTISIYQGITAAPAAPAPAATAPATAPRADRTTH
jgi:hypothetical protein